jgi:hypothetical protein
MGRPAQILIDSDWLCAGCVPDLRLRRSGGDKEWDVSVPMVVSVQEQNSLTFTASMYACKGRCKIPGGIGRITGTIRRLSDDQIQVDFRGSFQGPFILNLGE